MARGTECEARDAFVGAMAGIAATVAMTLAMDAMFRRLPPPERYPLPPRELTERAAEITGLDRRFDDSDLQLATFASHFALGTVAGALYGLLLPVRRMPALPAGIGYALTVWATSYLGWVPGSGLLRSAETHPPSRNALMIAAHVVWGAVLGVATRGLARISSPFRAGPLRDSP